jgi:transcriptional regulator with XRE-family HTH domain
VWRQWLQRSSSGDTALSSIGDRLKAAREQAGHALDHLAALTGLSKAHLSHLGSAERQP